METSIEERPTTPLGANGEAPQPMTTAMDDRAISALVDRVESLERQHVQLRRDALMIAGLTTIAAALAIATMFDKRMEPPSNVVQTVMHPRAISAQAFLLTDAQGHPRAKLTFE